MQGWCQNPYGFIWRGAAGRPIGLCIPLCIKSTHRFSGLTSSVCATPLNRPIRRAGSPVLHYIVPEQLPRACAMPEPLWIHMAGCCGTSNLAIYAAWIWTARLFGRRIFHPCYPSKSTNPSGWSSSLLPCCTWALAPCTCDARTLMDSHGVVMRGIQVGYLYMPRRMGTRRFSSLVTSVCCTPLNRPIRRPGTPVS